MKRCPFCAEEIQNAAVVCRYCQHKLVPAPAAPMPATRPVRPQWGRILAIVVLAIAALLWRSLPDTPALPTDLEAVSAARRHDLLFYGIRDADKPCGEVQRAERRGIAGLWAVDCSQGRYYLVSWSDRGRGVLTVMDCFDAKDRLGLTCWP